LVSNAPCATSVGGDLITPAAAPSIAHVSDRLCSGGFLIGALGRPVELPELSEFLLHNRSLLGSKKIGSSAESVGEHWIPHGPGRRLRGAYAAAPVKALRASSAEASALRVTGVLASALGATISGKGNFPLSQREQEVLRAHPDPGEPHEGAWPLVARGDAHG
jgi:hypothetical protein